MTFGQPKWIICRNVILPRGHTKIEQKFNQRALSNKLQTRDFGLNFLFSESKKRMSLAKSDSCFEEISLAKETEVYF